MSKERTWTIRHRITGELGTAFDVTDRTERELSKLLNALLRKVDFANWELIDSREPEGEK